MLILKYNTNLVYKGNTCIACISCFFIDTLAIYLLVLDYPRVNDMIDNLTAYQRRSILALKTHY